MMFLIEELSVLRKVRTVSLRVMCIKRLRASEIWLQLTCDKEFMTSFLDID